MTLKNLDEMLLRAASEGDAAECLRLIDEGANVAARSISDQTPLQIAAVAGNADNCRALLDSGAAVDITGRSGMSALLLAAYKDHVDVCRLLIERGANIDAMSANNVSVLHAAAGNGAAKACALLVEAGVNTRVYNEDGRTALHSAVLFDSVDVCRILVGAGMAPDEVSTKSSGFWSAMQRAVHVGSLNCVRYFALECGSDLRQVTEDGRTLEDLALGSVKTIEALNSLRAEVAINAEIGDTGRPAGSSRKRMDLTL
jgi:ankyrin repeat protein